MDEPYKAKFIRVPTPPNDVKQTVPVEPKDRIPVSEISIEECVPEDATLLVSNSVSLLPLD